MFFFYDASQIESSRYSQFPFTGDHAGSYILMIAPETVGMSV